MKMRVAENTPEARSLNYGCLTNFRSVTVIDCSLPSVRLDTLCGGSYRLKTSDPLLSTRSGQLSRSFSSFLFCSFGATGIYNNPRSTLTRDVRPDPLDKHAQPQAGLNQELKVDSSPCEPRHEPGEVNLAALQDREVWTDDGHAAFVEIPEGFPYWNVCDTFMN